jgi:Uma2 family endonuclease
MAAVDSITTAEQLFHMPELGRCELVRGELIMMSPAGSQHGAIAAELGGILRDFVKPRALGIVLGAETGFRIATNPDTVRAPDAAFVRAERVGAKLPQGFFPGAPDLAAEVISPDDRAGEVLAKVQDWLAAGCVAVWVVDPRTQTVTVYHGRGQAVVLASADTLAGGDLLPGFSVPVADIFTL